MRKSSKVLITGLTLALSAVCYAGESGESDATTTPSSDASNGGSERCAALGALMKDKWPDLSTRILEASFQPAGSQLKTMMGPVGPLPAHCEIVGVMHERLGADGQHYAIRFHLRMPTPWNGRFLFEGGGGTEGDLGLAVGFIAPATLPAVAQGFAVVSQDAGHNNATNSVVDHGGPVAFGFDPQARADYGGAALKPVADAAKSLVRTYYDSVPSHSYFVGCSKGGQEGMAFAQRYPDEFDGIVAGAPGFSLPRAALAEVWDTQAFSSLVAAPVDKEKASDVASLASTFSDEQFSAFREAILSACDADDGVRDGITAVFGRCTWPRVETELKARTCPQTIGKACLSQAQVNALKRVYGGPHDKTGKTLYSDWPLDAGAGSSGWRIWKIGAPNGTFPAINVTTGAPALAAIFTTPPTGMSADPQAALHYALEFSFDRDAPKIYSIETPFQRSAWTDISARSANLDAFRKHGGKLIVPHGASDPVFSLNDTIAWYSELDQREHGKASEFVRVFAVPGMAHCAGGPATDQFNALEALQAWVETGKSPDRIVATAGPSSPWPGRTRPLCPYPGAAHFSGSGSIEDAASFTCK